MGRLATMSALVLGISTFAVVIASPAEAAPPVNDNLASAELLTSPGDLLVSNVDATMEPGEAEQAPEVCGTVGYSMWYRFDATSDEVIRVGTNLAAGEQTIPDSVLTVYTSSTPATPTIASLSPIRCSDDFAQTANASVEVTVTTGTSYFIQLADRAGPGFDPPAVPVQLLFEEGQTPGNDDLAAAQPLTPGPVTSATTAFSTLEPQEPETTPCGDVYSSIWFTWTPSSTTRADLVVIDGFNNMSTVIGVYTAPPSPTAADLTFVDCGAFTGAFDANVTFATTPGTTYYLQIADEGSQQSHLFQGPRQLVLEIGDPPANNDLATATDTASPATFAVDNTYADLEPGEPHTPVSGCGASRIRTEWYRFTPTTSGELELQTSDLSISSDNPVIFVYSGPATGATFDQLVRVACNGPGYIPTFRVPVTAGQTYYVQAGSFNNKLGFNLHLRSTTTTTLTAAAPVTGTVTLAATVSATLGTPTGSVQFFDGTVPMGTAPLSGGTATLTLSGVAPGRHAYHAVYVPATGDYLTSTSLDQKLGWDVPPAPQLTSTRLKVPKKVTQNRRVTITVSVTKSDGQPATGPVIITVAGQTITVSLVDGRATTATKRLRKPGKVKVSASYAATADAEASQATARIRVRQRPRKT
jgi:hypothetical protein